MSECNEIIEIENNVFMFEPFRMCVHQLSKFSGIVTIPLINKIKSIEYE